MAGIINSIRSRAGVVVGFIVFSLLLFILSTALSDNFSALFQGDRTSVGEIAGERVDYNAFNTTYNSVLQQLGQNNNEQARDQALQQAWEQHVNQTLLTSEMEALGLTVTQSESTRLILGPDPSPLMLQIPDFRNPDGSFNSDRVRELIAQGRTNPQLNQQLRDLQLQVNANRKQEKYLALLSQGVFVSKAEARRLLQEQRNTLSFSYLAVNYGAIADSLVEVTDGDYRAFYNEQRERFRVAQPEAVLQYVAFAKLPTAADSAAVREEVARLKAEFATSTEDSLFAAQNSDGGSATRYQNILSVTDTLRGRVQNAKPGTVLGPLGNGAQLVLIKVLDQRRDTLPDARIKIILLRDNAALADSLARVATADNFGSLAIQFSEDPNSRFSGGDVGVYPFGALGAQVDAAVRNAGTGIIRRPVATPQGTFIIHVAEKSDREVRLAILTKDLVASPATINNLERQAREFAALATQQGLDSAAKSKGYELRTTVPITPASTSIPGLEQSRGLIQWAFVEDETSVGDQTDVRDLGNSLVVARLQSRVTGDYRELADVKEEIRAEVLNRKKAAYIKEQLGSTQGQELNALQGKVAGAFVSQAQNLNLLAPGVPGIGNDPAVVGAAFGLPVNQTSQPIEGQTGVFVLRVTEKKPADDTITDAEIAGLQERLLAQRKNQVVSRLFQGLREAARVKDYRYRYSF